MEHKTRIKGNVHYVGVNDRNKHRFEGMWPLPYGVSYNSYLIDDEMVALVDTVDICYFEVYLRKIKQVIGERPINYLIIKEEKGSTVSGEPFFYEFRRSTVLTPLTALIFLTSMFRELVSLTSTAKFPWKMPSTESIFNERSVTLLSFPITEVILVTIVISSRPITRRVTT